MRIIPIIIIFLVAGTLDILAAFTHAYSRGVMPKNVLKYIAGGVYGVKDSMAGGINLIALGLVFHYLIALVFTICFVVLYRNWKLIRGNAIVSGLVFGLFAWLIMNQVVMPMSSLPDPAPFVFKKAIVGMLILMLFFGLPIAVLTHHYFRQRN